MTVGGVGGLVSDVAILLVEDDLHANVFVTKPVDFDRFADVVRQIDDFFLTVARLPPVG